MTEFDLFLLRRATTHQRTTACLAEGIVPADVLQKVLDAQAALEGLLAYAEREVEVVG